MITIANASAQIQANPVPVIFIDICSLLDLFRRDAKSFQPRVPADEIQAAAKLLDLITASPDAAHLIVPELIPREYADHADAIEREFGLWTRHHDENQDWIIQAASCVAVSIPHPSAIHHLGFASRFRALADELLARSLVLDRAAGCLDRAVIRLITKCRPSHRKEMKDSMNLEQCLELSRQLHHAGFAKSRVFVSSNTNDFADAATTSMVHADLQGDFSAAGLDYYTSFRSAIRQLRLNGEIP
jgi:hypothetical protein